MLRLRLDASWWVDIHMSRWHLTEGESEWNTERDKKQLV